MQIRTTTTTIGPAALVLLLAVLGTGCEDSAVLPPANATMLVSASAPLVSADGTTASTAITAQLLGAGATGATGSTGSTGEQPVENVTVFFSTDGGAVAPEQRETDISGVAVTTLTVMTTDPDSVTVTARAGSVTETISISNPVGFPDAEAVIVVDQESPASLSTDLPILFRSESVDPDDESTQITCVRWRVVGETFEKYGKIGEDQGLSTADFNWVLPGDPEQELRVQLAVTESPAAATICDATTSFSNSVDFLGGFFLCRNTAPVAAIDQGPLLSVTLSGGSATVPLSGSDSDGTGTNIGEYRWDCDNGEADLLGETVTCAYTVPGTYTVILTVEDLGLGLFECRLTDTQTTTVVVTST